VKVLTKQFMLL